LADSSTTWIAVGSVGTFVAAVATTGVALVTRSVATRTKDVAGETQELAGETRKLAVATEASVSAQIRPVLIDLPLDLGEPNDSVFYAGSRDPISVPRGGVHVFANEDGIRISIPLRNAGAGLAMIRAIALEVGEPIPQPATTIQPANVPRGERGRVSFVAAHDHPRLDAIRAALEPAYGTFSVAVSYSDLAGQHVALSRFDVSFRSEAHMKWEVRQVHLSTAGSDEPFAGSAPVG
jgi:hypothetical protein